MSIFTLVCDSSACSATKFEQKEPCLLSAGPPVWPLQSFNLLIPGTTRVPERQAEPNLRTFAQNWKTEDDHRLSEPEKYWLQLTAYDLDKIKRL